MKSYLVVSAAVSAVVAMAHLGRALAGIPVEVAGVPIPQSVSWVAFVGIAALCFWALRLLRTGAFRA